MDIDYYKIYILEKWEETCGGLATGFIFHIVITKNDSFLLIKKSLTFYNPNIELAMKI